MKGLAVQARTPHRSPDGASDDWLSEPLRARDGLELLRGLDGRPLLYDPPRRQYLLVSPRGAAVLGLLGGSRNGYEIADAAAGSGATRARQREEVFRFLAGLKDAGLLDGGLAVSASPIEMLGWVAAGSRLLVRLRLTRSLARALDAIGRIVNRIPRAAGLVVLFLLALVLPLCIAVALAREHGRPPALLWMLLPLRAAQVIAHELAHAFMCQRYGVPIREAGIGLLVNLMPVAYVDRTDAYRLRERRQRVLIALAGPVNDVVWAGGYAMLSLILDGDVGRLAQWGLLLALVIVAANLNPLMPSDGFQALEAGCGFINLRGRVIATLIDTVRGRRGGTIAAPRSAHRFVYLAVAVVWMLYLSTVAVALVTRSLSLLPGASR